MIELIDEIVHLIDWLHIDEVEDDDILVGDDMIDEAEVELDIIIVCHEHDVADNDIIDEVIIDIEVDDDDEHEVLDAIELIIVIDDYDEIESVAI